ncbi:MAG: hypothetical protein HY814_02865 [Candidatus Riflebacteria bacterium]|nr:hypothetical protein [Candidatus Riflebacteria bacterium]
MKHERNEANRLFQTATHTLEHGRPTSALLSQTPGRKRTRTRKHSGLPTDILTRTMLLF